jgi:hypothetical protein
MKNFSKFVENITKNKSNASPIDTTSTLNWDEIPQKR